MPYPRKRQRNEEIVRLAASGMPYPEIAAKYGLSVSRVSFVARLYGGVRRGCGWKGHLWWRFDRKMRDMAKKMPPGRGSRGMG